MTARRITLLITTVFAVITYLISENLPTVDTLLSANMTKIMEVTNLSAGMVAAIIIALVGIFIYLWIDAGKEDKMDILIKQIKSLNCKMSRIERKLGNKRHR